MYPRARTAVLSSRVDLKRSACEAGARGANDGAKSMKTHLALVAAMLLATADEVLAATYTTFDPKGSVETVPVAINNGPSITGYWIDGSAVTHGFLRASDGTITKFDPKNSTATFPIGINATGWIVGFFDDANGEHGFLRAPDGSITTYDAPKSAGLTDLYGIDKKGLAAGYYQDSQGAIHGLTRNSNGKTKIFDVSGA